MFISKLSDNLNYIIEQMAMVFILIISILTFTGVLSRYIFGIPIVWLYETTLVLFSWTIFLGISIAFKKDEHIKLDLIYHYLSSKAAKVVNFIVKIISIIFLLILLKDSIEIVKSTITQRYITINLSTAWFYIPLTICAVVSLIHVIDQFIDQFRIDENKN